MTTYFGFALADGMFSETGGGCTIVRRTLTEDEVRDRVEKGLEPCLNPSHGATITAMRERFGIDVPIPDPDDMPYHPYERSEMFYLTALLWKKRNDPSRHKHYLKMCIAEDPTRRWPAYLGKSALDGLYNTNIDGILNRPAN